MRFLADECCDAAVVKALRSAGHDVLAISEFETSSVDHELMERALTQQRILLTEDKDFGWFVYAGHIESPGVILIRFPALARSTLVEMMLKLVSDYSSELIGPFVVLQPGLVRISARSTPG